MAETYLEITQQIEELKHKAASIREAEIAGVVERIQVAIQAYGLTVEQLFGAAVAAGRQPRSGRTAVEPKRSAAPRYSDGDGHSWSGRGPRPRWIKAALADGKTLADFATPASNGEDSPAAASESRTAPRPVSVPKYRDDAGHTWSGRGPRPRWLKAALDAGKTLEQLS